LKRAAPPKKDPEKNGEEKTEGGEKAPPAEGSPDLIDGVWEQLSDDKAIHKACQVMRDINRPDRKFREERKEARKKQKLSKLNGAPSDESEKKEEDEDGKGDGEAVKMDVDSKEAESPKDPKSNDEEMKELAEKAAVEVVDKALAAGPSETAEV
jgi:hypothetical protein